MQRRALAGLLLLAGGGVVCRAAPTGWQYSCSAAENVTSISYPLHGLVWLVTGADGRLGYPITSAALRNGARVVATSIDAATATANCARLNTDFPNANVSCVAMDLSSFSDIKQTIAAVAKANPVFDVVAHIAATAGRPNLTADGIVETVQVNTIAPALMNVLLEKQIAAAVRPRVVHVGSASCYDPLEWPATNQVDAAVELTTGKKPHPGTNPYYWYSFSKYVLTQYAVEYAKRVPTVTSFTVNPGFFRDDPSKYADQCKPQLLFTPCPQYPDQGASSTFFTAAQPGIEAFSGSLIDFDTKVTRTAPYWVQSGDSCIPRALPPPWTESERSDWFDAVQKLIAAATLA
eukprot:m.378778 g.378778  ORF g.378778 m.378778 type:complete len:348 (+) comp16708_c4_seq3:167-1210(+)